jgi:hypothetical protein
MSQKSQAKAVHLDTPPPRVWAARYSAVVGDAIASSNVELNAALPSAQLQWAIQVAPEWSLDPWPTDVTDLKVLAVAKFKALFDYAAQLTGNDRVSLERDLRRQFPTLIGTNDGVKQCPVTAIIRAEDGKAEWEVTVPEAGALPRGILSTEMGPRDPYKLLVQNLIRADLMGRLGR